MIRKLLLRAKRKARRKALREAEDLGPTKRNCKDCGRYLQLVGGRLQYCVCHYQNLTGKPRKRYSWKRYAKSLLTTK